MTLLKKYYQIALLKRGYPSYKATLSLLQKRGWGYCNNLFFYTPTPRRGRGVYCFTSVCLSVCLSVLPSIQDIFRRIFLSNLFEFWSTLHKIILHKNQQSLQTGSRYLTDPKNASHNMAYLFGYMKLVTKYQIPVNNSCRRKMCIYVKCV
jgi:hypothetical protein